MGAAATVAAAGVALVKKEKRAARRNQVACQATAVAESTKVPDSQRHAVGTPPRARIKKGTSAGRIHCTGFFRPKCKKGKGHQNRAPSLLEPRVFF